MLKKEFGTKILRFAAVGIVVMGFFMASNWLLEHWFDSQAAFFIAYPPALGLHFCLNKWWTFQDRRVLTVRQVGEYLGMAGITFVIQWSVFTALHAWTNLPGWIGAGAANATQMLVSFVIMQVRIFAHRSDDKEPSI